MTNPGSNDLVLGDMGIAWLEVAAGHGSSRLTLDSLHRLELALVQAGGLISRGEAQVLIVAAGPVHPDLTGYDPDELRSFGSDEMVAWSREGQRILRRLE